MTTCSRCVGEEKPMIKYGKTKSGNQRLYFRKCGKTQVHTYIYQAYQSKLNRQIITLTKEGLGIRSTSRVLDISNTTLIKRILYIADGIQQPIIKMGRTYELDEMRTFIQNKNRIVWLIYALDKESREIVGYN